MNPEADVYSWLSGAGDGKPKFVPDLTLWFRHHKQGRTLPEEWQDLELSEIARELGLPIWDVVRPWRVETTGIAIEESESDGVRQTRYETSAGILSESWSLGPDGSWWKTKYPVKSSNDLKAAAELVQSQSYIIDPSRLKVKDNGVENGKVPAVELPQRPYTDLLYRLLGLSEGPILLMEDPPGIREMILSLEEKLQLLVEEVVQLPSDLVLAPDNLDAQFISPVAFDEFLAESYRVSAETVHQQSKQLLVFVGGPIKRLLPGLAEAGVDGVEGISSPPQSDASLSQAREVLGPDFTLWGGIPQDYLLSAHDQQTFEDAVIQAAREANGDPRIVLGVADRVPVEAELSRLKAIPSIVDQAL